MYGVTELREEHFFKDRVIKSNQISSETQIERRSSQQGAVIVKVRCLKGGG